MDMFKKCMDYKVEGVGPRGG